MVDLSSKNTEYIRNFERVTYAEPVLTRNLTLF